MEKRCLPVPHLGAAVPVAFRFEPPQAPAVLPLLALAIAARPDDPALRLLEAATRAAQGHRTAEVTQRMRGWATLGGGGTVPPVLKSAADDAAAWVLEAGRFRLYASRAGDRVRVGLNDPAKIVERVEAVATLAGARAPLQRAEGEAPGRMEFILEPTIPGGAIIEVSAITRVEGEEVFLRQVVLALAGPVPAPSAPALGAAPPPRPDFRPAPEAEPGEALPWWWIAAGVAAAALVGAAVVQEARF